MPLHDIRSVHLPYNLSRQKDGSYFILNREYKPLGFKNDDHGGYDAYPIRVMIKGLTPKVASKLSFEGSNDINEIYLYNDGTVPTKSEINWQQYAKRLAILARLKVS